MPNDGFEIIGSTEVVINFDWANPNGSESIEPQPWRLTPPPRVTIQGDGTYMLELHIGRNTLRFITPVLDDCAKLAKGIAAAATARRKAERQLMAGE